MCYFPNNLEYNGNLPGLADGGEEQIVGTAKGMYSRLKNLGIVDNHFLDGVGGVNDLERRIFSLIDGYPENNASLERVFHMIQIWGGSTGAGIYTKQSFNWTVIGPLYQQLIDVCRGIADVTPESRARVYSAIQSYYRSLHDNGIKGMGVAFITKHTRYWMHRNLPDMMLPIYDSTFSEHVMRKGKTAEFKDLLAYWDGMARKAQAESISLAALERVLFNHYRFGNQTINAPIIQHSHNEIEGVFPINNNEISLRRRGNHAVSGYRFHLGDEDLFLYVGEFDKTKDVFCQILPKGKDKHTTDLQFLTGCGLEYYASEGRFFRKFKAGQISEAEQLMESLKEPIARAIWGADADKYLNP